MTALLLAALSAVLYGAGIAFEHRQAARLPAEVTGRPRMLALLAREPWWLAGAALETGGFVTHAAALRTGSLAAVQMVLSCSLLVSIAVSSGFARRTLPRHGWPAILAIVTAVGAILTLLGPDDHGAGQAPGRLGLAAVAAGAITVPIAAAGLLATRQHTRALLLAVAAGLADTCAAVVTMAFMHSLAHGLGATVTSWPPYALIVAGLASLLLAQTAYQTDVPLITLPTITAVMPLACLAVGIVALRETAHLNGARIVIMTACLAVALTALAGLARAAAAVAEASKQPDDDHPPAALMTSTAPMPARGRADRRDRFIVGVGRLETGISVLTFPSARSPAASAEHASAADQEKPSCPATRGGSQSSPARVQVTARQLPKLCSPRVPASLCSTMPRSR
jgi:drug/metabolite transporter (DMT)-like permease